MKIGFAGGSSIMEHSLQELAGRPPGTACSISSATHLTISSRPFNYDKVKAKVGFLNKYANIYLFSEFLKEENVT